MPDMPISLPYYLFVAFTLAAKPSRTRCNSAVKVVSSADEKDANTACNRVALASVALLMAASVAAGGYLYWDYAGHFESTDDAYIAARQFAIAPEVSGYITAVPVTDNERVAASEVTLVSTIAITASRSPRPRHKWPPPRPTSRISMRRRECKQVPNRQCGKALQHRGFRNALCQTFGRVMRFSTKP